MKFDVKTIEAAKAGTVELSDAIFGLDPRVDLIHRVIQWQLNKRQQGTHQAKSRGEINRTTHKLGNQKGGGTARHGSRKAGIFVGGGKAFGPRFRSHETSLNKKVRALGLKMALSAKLGTQSLIVLDRAAMDVRAPRDGGGRRHPPLGRRRPDACARGPGRAPRSQVRIHHIGRGVIGAGISHRSHVLRLRFQIWQVGPALVCSQRNAGKCEKTSAMRHASEYQRRLPLLLPTGPVGTSPTRKLSNSRVAKCGT